MFHMCAMRKASVVTANDDQTPVNDQIMLVQNNHFVPQQDMFLLFAKVNGVTLARARLTSPYIRTISPVFIRPIDAALLQTTLTRPSNWVKSPLRLKALEEFAIEATNTGAGGDIQTISLGLAVDPVTPVPNGDIFSMRGTGTTTAVAGAWTQAAITWADILPAGKYAIVGMNAVGATLQAARIIPQNAPFWRPGCTGGPAEATIVDEIFRNGALGIWTTFNAYGMPNIEVLCNAADTAQTIYLDIIKIG